MQESGLSEIEAHNLDSSPPAIPYPTVTEYDNPYDLSDFWHAAASWLACKGVTLYQMGPPEGASPNSTSPDVWYTPLADTAGAALLPYARCVHGGSHISRGFSTTPRLACGQDAQGRDIMLKIMDIDSYQYRVYHALLRQLDTFADQNLFPCVLPPLAILDTPHNYAVVSMPMWANPVHIEDMRTIREVSRFIECLLQGLTFLHANRIAHRDICEDNIVVNCYRLDQCKEYLQEDLRRHRADGEVFYALMDFDQSIQHPEGVPLKYFRRPAGEAMHGSILYRPDDVCLGEPDYNPFAFDVAMLGNLFRVHFVGAVPALPALAALFDGMTTHVQSQRFTAEEAWLFYHTEIADLPRAVLEAAVEPSQNWFAMADPNVYWSTLSPEAQNSWGHFRAPPWPRWSEILNWFILFPKLCPIIVSTRRILGI